MSDSKRRVKPDGTVVYRKRGLLHRLDGPAIVRPDGKNGWFIDGGELAEYEFGIFAGGVPHVRVVRAILRHRRDPDCVRRLTEMVRARLGPMPAEWMIAMFDSPGACRCRL